MRAWRTTALAGGAAAVAWELQRRRDRQRIKADPAHAALTEPLSGRPLPVQSADGIELHAEAFGPEDAPTIVLVHGWTCTLGFWVHQIRALSDEFRVVAYDLRGHGRSAAPADASYSIGSFAADLDAVLTACVPDGERAVVAGHSLGAMTLAVWAHAHREQAASRLAGAALVNTGLGDLIAESLLFRAPTPLARARQAALRALLSSKAPIPLGPTPISHRVIRHLTLGPEASPATVAFCERMVLECRREVRAACGATISELEEREAIRSLEAPAVVLAGAADKMTPPRHARQLAAELPQLVAHVEIPRCGHMGPVECPHEVSEQLRRLTRAVAPQAERRLREAAA